MKKHFSNPLKVTIMVVLLLFLFSAGAPSNKYAKNGTGIVYYSQYPTGGTEKNNSGLIAFDRGHQCLKDDTGTTMCSNVLGSGNNNK